MKPAKVVGLFIDLLFLVASLSTGGRLADKPPDRCPGRRWRCRGPRVVSDRSISRAAP